MLIEIEEYAGEGRIYSFYTENEGSDDHYLFKNLRKVAEISTFKTLNIDLLIPKIYPHKDEEMILQYEKEIKDDQYVWVKAPKGTSLNLDLY
jgi:hypothetical protein